jgi:hypothetical protein
MWGNISICALFVAGRTNSIGSRPPPVRTQLSAAVTAVLALPETLVASIHLIVAGKLSVDKIYSINHSGMFAAKGKSQAEHPFTRLTYTIRRPTEAPKQCKSADGCNAM